MNNKTELLPCPNLRCGSTFNNTIKIRNESLDEYPLYAVECVDCGLRGPYGVMSSIAEMYWNEMNTREPKEAWQPIETAPKDGTPVLVYWAAQEVITEAWYGDLEDGEGKNWYTTSADFLPLRELTHWQPRPSPPKESL